MGNPLVWPLAIHHRDGRHRKLCGGLRSSCRACWSQGLLLRVLVLSILQSSLVVSIRTTSDVSLQFTTLVGIAIEIPFALGEAFLGLEAFFIR